MNIKYCIKCCSHYMNGDDEWCDHYDDYSEVATDVGYCAVLLEQRRERLQKRGRTL